METLDEIKIKKPIKRTLTELSQSNFVDFLLETYSPKKNSAGEYFSMALDYLTNETNYMASDTEKEFVEEYGLSPIGFLEILRIQMAKTSGFGICINNKDLKKAMSNMVIDYDLDLAEMQKYYDQLLEFGLLIIISDHAGNKYVTSIQQVFNWEYKMWTRWKNNEYQKNHRSNKTEESVKVSDTVPIVPASKVMSYDEDDPDTWSLF